MINSNAAKIKTYVGSDGKLHFVDSAGADTALNFSKGTNSIKVCDISDNSTTTIDIKSLLPSNYSKLTASNFYSKNLVIMFWAWEVGSFAGKSTTASFGATFSYNNTTGVLTITPAYALFQLSDVAIQIRTRTEIWCEY